MKKLLLILLCLPLIGFGQLTMIPDANFEQALINLGYDTGVPNGSVPTAAIDTAIDLNISSMNISDLTGIEEFTSLVTLSCRDNQLTSLDLSSNTNLVTLSCSNNQLTSLDLSSNIALTEVRVGANQLISLNISNNINLEELWCYENELTSLDLSNNTNLTRLSCIDNQLTSLDVSNNIALDRLAVYLNQLTCLDVSNNTVLTELLCFCNPLEQLNTKNGNWQNMFVGTFSDEPELPFYDNLLCAEVDDITFANTYWEFGSFTSLNTNCNYTNPCIIPSAIKEQTTNKALHKVTDLLGRETKGPNQPLFYIYDDGTVEKRIVIE